MPRQCPIGAIPLLAFMCALITPRFAAAQTGACCSGTICTIETGAVCTSTGRTYQGDGTTCQCNPCGIVVRGACCRSSACTFVPSACCTIGGGAFQGAATTCGTAANPTTCCPANFNGTGGVTVQDVFDFLSAWFARTPNADFNHSGSVTVQDLFDFLAAWFALC